MLRLILDQSVRRRGTTLAGGSPKRIMRLTAAGWSAIAELQSGGTASVPVRELGRRLLEAGLAHPRPAHRCDVSDVTVVVPVRDRPQQLERCLLALGRQAPLIVVDDGSLDGDTLAAVAARHSAHLVRRGRAGGPAAARNSALADVRTSLVAFLDSDCVPSRDWLHALAGHFDDPAVGAVAPRVRPVSRAGASPLQRYLAVRSPLDMGCAPASVEPGGPVSYVPSAALIVRASAMDGGFDPALRYGEDVDLVWRLGDAGWRVRYDPSVEIGHAEPEALWDALVRRFRYGTSAAPLADRHPGRLAPVVIAPWPALWAMLTLSRRHRAAALLAGQQSVALAHRVGRLGLPPTWGLRWSAEANYHAVLAITRCVTTFGLPLALAYAWRARRPAMIAVLATPALEEWRRRGPALDPVRFIALAMTDDAAYGAGVLWGCVRARSVAPLIPKLTSGPWRWDPARAVRWSAPRRSGAHDR